MPVVGGRKVILATFAGRRDRMQLLVAYAREAMQRGLIDEWHIWDFTRNADDRSWLQETFTDLGRTPNADLWYKAGSLTLRSGRESNWQASVRARSDAHIGLRPASTDNPAYEFIIGGWGDNRTVLRRTPGGELLTQHERRTGPVEWLDAIDTPGILSGSCYRDVAVRVTSGSIELWVDQIRVCGVKCDMPATDYEVHVRSGYGAEAEWSFPNRSTARGTLFMSARSTFPPWADFYDFYTARVRDYEDTIFLKCDDDVVYWQLERLAEFIQFRIANPQFLIVSANIINNGVCAHYQQRSGIIPPEILELELPPGGVGGTLWASPRKAEDLHQYFLANRDAFESMSREPIIWNERLSINFISWIGRDMSWMSTAYDDERVMTQELPRYTGRQNCIYPGFVASHLTFGPQDAGFDHAGILSAYAGLLRDQYFEEANL